MFSLYFLLITLYLLLLYLFHISIKIGDFLFALAKTKYRTIFKYQSYQKCIFTAQISYLYDIFQIIFLFVALVQIR